VRLVREWRLRQQIAVCAAPTNQPTAVDAGSLCCCRRHYHRDLIDGTDKIIDISTKCHGILGNVLAIQVQACVHLQQ
jgi:hypothetical protein